MSVIIVQYEDPGQRAEARDDTLNRVVSEPALPSMRWRFVRETAQAIDRECQIVPGDTIVVAVSGGADSLSLLAALSTISRKPHRRYVLEVVYVHHHLRPQADVEAVAVRDLSNLLGWRFHQQDVYPDGQDGNLASSARDLRYCALAQIAEKTNATAIATAHHGTDQLETLLLNLVRGAGLDGLAGMPWRTNLMGATVIRPLLNQSHDDCVRLCRKLGWKWFEDASNRDETKNRNLIRAKIVPILYQMAPDLESRVWRTTELLRAAATIIREVVNESFGDSAIRADGSRILSRKSLCNLNDLVLGEGLRQMAGRSGVTVDALSFPMIRQVIDAIRDHAEHRREICWPGGVRIVVSSKQVEIWPTDRPGFDPEGTSTRKDAEQI